MTDYKNPKRDLINDNQCMNCGTKMTCVLGERIVYPKHARMWSRRIKTITPVLYICGTCGAMYIPTTLQRVEIKDEHSGENT